MLDLLRQMVLTDTVRVALGLPPLAGGVMDDTVDVEAESPETDVTLGSAGQHVIHSDEIGIL